MQYTKKSGRLPRSDKISSEKQAEYMWEMKKFEYKITRHSAEEFSELVYFCSEKGDCAIEQVPHDQTETLQKILNAEGTEGWELVQISFGPGGIIVFWKKQFADSGLG